MHIGVPFLYLFLKISLSVRSVDLVVLTCANQLTDEVVKWLSGQTVNGRQLSGQTIKWSNNYGEVVKQLTIKCSNN